MTNPTYHQRTWLLTPTRFLSKAPGKVQDYDGSGKWAKIFDWGPTFSGGQVTWPLRCEFQGDVKDHIEY